MPVADRGALAPVARVVHHHVHTSGRPEPVEDLPGPVAGAVVHRDDLEVSGTARTRSTTAATVRSSL